MEVVWVAGVVLGIATIAVALLRERGSALRKLPATPIGDAPEREHVKIRGIVGAEEPLTAPYSGRTCVYYKLIMSQGRPGERADLFVENRCDFSVEDETGTARVLAERATFEVVADLVELERSSRLSDKARKLARQYGWSLADIARVDIREAAVVVGESIDVAGKAIRTPNPDADHKQRQYRDAPPTIPVFSSETTVLGEAREPVWVE